MSEDARLTALVRGHVQGVGFRVWTRRTAEALGLTGHAHNLPDGRVEVVADGPRTACAQLLAALRSTSAPGRVSEVEATWSTADGSTRAFTTG